MPILEIEKIRIFTHKEKINKVVEIIQNLGFVEFTEIKEIENLKREEKKDFEFDYVSSKLDFAVEFLSKFSREKNTLKKIIEGDKIDISEKEIHQISESFYFNDIVDKTQNIETELSFLKTKLKELEKEERLLKPWENLNTSLREGLETNRTETVFIFKEIFNEEDLLEKKLKEDKLIYHIDHFSKNHLTLTFLKEDKKNILKIINDSDLEIQELPKRRGNPKEELERIERAKIKINKKIKIEEEKAFSLSKDLERLKIVSDYFLWRKQRHYSLDRSLQTLSISFFEGWCPKEKINILKKEIEKETNLFEIEKLELNQSEKPPVEIENKKIFKPFESITRLYGLPGKKEVDPTPFLAPFFFIFFGLCLSDVGYGIIVLLTSLIINIKYKISKEAKSFVNLLALGGISSILAGILFGGYFGINLEIFPQWLQKLQKFNPIESPLIVLYMTLALGVLQVIIGMLLSMLKEMKNKNTLNGVLDTGPWLLLFFSIGIFTANSFSIIELEKSLYIVILSILLIVLTQGRKEKGVFKKITKGVFSLYNSISYFSDILSYSRILALGLATTALAFAVNLIAQIANEMIPYVGVIFMVIILIFGHIFNMAVNILGAFIHSARLQFVEFFGKFITESGKKFNPFRKEERYIRLD